MKLNLPIKKIFTLITKVAYNNIDMVSDINVNVV